MIKENHQDNSHAESLSFHVKLLIILVRTYQITISPVLGKSCKHYPSCSSYSLESIKTYGALKGLLLTFFRLLRCNPWSLGGHDPLPENVRFSEPRSFKIKGNYETRLYQVEE